MSAPPVFVVAGLAESALLYLWRGLLCSVGSCVVAETGCAWHWLLAFRTLWRCPPWERCPFCLTLSFALRLERGAASPRQYLRQL